MFKYDGGFAQFFTKDIESWKHSLKWFVSNSRFDWNVVKDLNEKETFKLLTKSFLESLDRIENMKRKPKDFENRKFRNDMEVILKEFELRKYVVLS